MSHTQRCKQGEHLQTLGFSRTNCLSQIQVPLKWSSWTDLRTLEIKHGSVGE